MTHLEVLKEIVEKEPWTIVRGLWDCFSCPMLSECSKTKPQTKESCNSLIKKWLDLEEDDTAASTVNNIF